MLRSSCQNRSTRGRVRLGLLLLLVLLVPALAALGRDVPYLSGRVVDEAELLSAETEQRLTDRLAKLEEEKGAQLVVLTIDSLEGEALEDFSLRVAETWELGREDVDDGVLLLVVSGERKMRLEVGYGLESVLTDALSGRVLDEVLRPRFRQGDFEGGIEAGVDTVAKIIGGAGEDALPPPRDSSGPDMSLWERILMLGFLTIVLGPFMAIALFSKGGMAWFFYIFLMPFLWAFPWVALGTPWGFLPGVAWLIGFPILRGYVARKGLVTIKWQSGSGSGGSSWSSSSSSWSSSSSSFSGGGGSFGGGGASSSW